MAPTIEPSAVIARALRTVQQQGLGQLTRELALSRVDSYSSNLEAELSGVAMDAVARLNANLAFESAWASAPVGDTLLPDDDAAVGEVIIGSGYHAAVYAATRVRMGFPRPIVLERGLPAQVGGAFAVTTRPTFWLNSRNRPGGPGIAGDSRTSLNYIPGGIIQPASIGMREFQSNADMAFCIRATLAQYATVLPYCTVTDLEVASGRPVKVSVVNSNRGNTFTFEAQRVIDARGLGDPVSPSESPYVVSFPEFLRRMGEQSFPLRGLRRVAVVGGGDSAKCAVESFLGLAPEPFMAPVGVDHVERIDWYGPTVPAKCKEWTRTENDRGEQVRGRYRAIGHYLRRDAYGLRRLNVINASVTPAPFPDGALIQDNVYDLVVMCTGYRLPDLDGVNPFLRSLVLSAGGSPIAQVFNRRVFQVGPAADLPFTFVEQQNGVANFTQNKVSMFRTGKMTAALAVKLPNAV